MFCQPELEAMLEVGASSFPTLDLRRGVRVRGIDPTPTTWSSSRRRRARPVGRSRADGTTGPSPLRGGLRRHEQHRARPHRHRRDDLGSSYDWLIVDVVLDEPPGLDPINVQICDPARPTTVVSGGPGRRRWEFMRLPGERLDELNDETRAWELLEPWDVHPGNAGSNATPSTPSRPATPKQWRGAAC
jgi:flavoprotein hydroxylase